jgi:hypothetical protein
MDKFFSIDRKVLLKSAAAGVSIISLLSLVLLTESMILWGLAFFGVLATYWFVPTWFSRDRQLEKRAIKCSPFKNAKTYGPTIPEYKIVCPKGKEFKTPCDTEKCLTDLVLLAISTILLFVTYDSLIKVLLTNYSNLETSMPSIAAIIYLTTPYLIRHCYCFTLNRSMNTSLQFFHNLALSNGAGTPYIHTINNNKRSLNIHTPKISNNRSFITNPAYSSLSANIYHRR